MSIKQFFFFLFAASTLLLGCSKNYEKYVVTNSSDSDTIWANTLINTMSVNALYQNLAINPFTDSVSAQTGGTIYFPYNNISISIPANAFLLNGTALTSGKATIHFLLITRKGDMVRMCLPTQSNGYLLESGGEFYLDAVKNDTQLTLATGKQITINYNSFSQPNILMKGFTGTTPTSATGSNSCFNWTPAYTDLKVSTTANGYQLITDSLHWLNCDYFNDSSASKTTVAVSMPLGFTNTNTYTFIVFKNSNGVMQFDADAGNQIWVKTKVPINKPVVYVSISKRGGDYYLSTYDSYTTTNQYIVLKPVKQSIQDILGYLGTL